MTNEPTQSVKIGRTLKMNQIEFILCWVLQCSKENKENQIVTL